MAPLTGSSGSSSTGRRAAAPTQPTPRTSRSVRFPLAAPVVADARSSGRIPSARSGSTTTTSGPAATPVRLARSRVHGQHHAPAGRLGARSPATVRGLEHLRHLRGPGDLRRQITPATSTPLCSADPPCRSSSAITPSSPPPRTTSSDRKWKSIMWSFALAAIPIERSKVNHRSAGHRRRAHQRRMEPGHIPRRGARSPTGGRNRSIRRERTYSGPTGPVGPVIPVFLHGTRHVAAKTPDDTVSASGTGMSSGSPGPRRIQAPSPRRGGRSAPCPHFRSCSAHPCRSIEGGEHSGASPDRAEASVATLARESGPRRPGEGEARRAGQRSGSGRRRRRDGAPAALEAPAWRRSWALGRPTALEGRGHTSWPE